MRSFTLHEDDGTPESNAKTDELHAFLRPLCNENTAHDFEGSNLGLSIWFTVEVGDTMLMRDDNSFVILDRDKPVAITRYSFPMTHLAMLTVEHDNGAHHLNRIHKMEDLDPVVDLERFEMPYSYGVDKLVKCENALYALMVNDKLPGFEIFVIGEQGEQESVIKSLDALIPDLPTAHALLNDWFNGWESE